MFLRRLGVVLIVAALAGTALAQQPVPIVAGLANVEGNVLVSQGDAMVAGGNGQRVAIGARVVTTASARATVSYDSGCQVRLGENQQFTVRPAGDCAALLASVETLGPAAGAIGGGAAGGVAAGGTAGLFSATGGLIAVGVVGGIAVYEDAKNNNKPKSPN